MSRRRSGDHREGTRAQSPAASACLRACVVCSVLSAVLAAPGARAQDTTVTADVDARRVGLEDQVQFTISVSGPAIDLTQEPELPPLKNLRAVGGPFTSQQFSFVNGAASQARSYTWALQPLKAGSAEVGAARVMLKSGERTTGPLTIEVVAGSARPPARRRSLDPFGNDPFGDVFGRPRRPQREPKLFVDAAASRARLHVGEPLVLTYSIYTQVSLTDLQFREPPQYPGFWSEDLDKPKEPPSGEPAVVEGESYRRFRVIEKLLFPTRAGVLTIPATAVRIGVATQSFFDAGGVVAERATKPIAITVDAIPSEAGFDGAVGRFKATASLDRSEVAFGEAATLRFQVEGAGNLKWVEKGPEPSVPGAKVYPPQTKNALRVGRDGVSGSRTWEYVVIPETSGTLQIPPLSFAYFDPQAERIVRTETPALTLRVAGATGGAAALQPTLAAPRASAPGGMTLRSDLDLARRLLPAIAPGTLGLALGIALALHAGLLGAARLRERALLAEGRGAAPRRSLRAALADLERAGRDGLNKEAAAALIERALHEAFGPVEDGGAQPATERERVARALLQEVHFIRYAPQLGDYGEKIREVAGRAEQAVRKWA